MSGHKYDTGGAIDRSTRYDAPGSTAGRPKGRPIEPVAYKIRTAENAAEWYVLDARGPGGFPVAAFVPLGDRDDGDRPAALDPLKVADADGYAIEDVLPVSDVLGGVSR